MDIIWQVVIYFGKRQLHQNNSTNFNSLSDEVVDEFVSGT